MNEHKISVGIAGASGYVGAELLRWLLPHPRVSVSWIASRDKHGQSLSSVLRQFESCSDLRFSQITDVPADLDFLFVAFPHLESMQYISDILKTHPSLKVIDLGADFRLSVDRFERIYKRTHVNPALLPQVVAGLPDIIPDSIRSARIIANPGCFAHCAILALAPLAAHKLELNLPGGSVYISAVTGSSGSGASVTQRTHHPERHDSLTCYNVFSHRHIPEIEQAYSKLSGNEQTIQVKLVPHSGPFSRGIYATCFVRLPAENIDIAGLYSSFWEKHQFVRVRADTPRLIDVQGTNFCDMSVHQDGRDVAIVCALDNLGKGASSNAVQCMNIMAGFNAHEGLVHSGLVP